MYHVLIACASVDVHCAILYCCRKPEIFYIIVQKRWGRSDDWFAEGYMWFGRLVLQSVATYELGDQEFDFGPIDSRGVLPHLP